MPLWFAIALFAEGLIAAAIAQSVFRALRPSGSVVLGLVGAFLGGVIAWLFINSGVGLVFAAVGAIALLYARDRFVEHR